MVMCIAKVAQKLLEVMLVRIGIAIETEEVDWGFDMSF